MYSVSHHKIVTLSWLLLAVRPFFIFLGVTAIFCFCLLTFHNSIEGCCYEHSILAMGESIEQTYPQDYLGNPYQQFELLRSIKNYDDVAAVLSIADGSLTTHWIEYGQARYGVKILGGVTAAMVTTYDPYLASGQMQAMMGGLRGAAEYEQLIEIEGGGARGMLAQSSAHIYVVLLIILGNVAYFTSRKRKKGA